MTHIREQVPGGGGDAARLDRLEEQLRQLQKVEALARLAPGIAHDFNNVLTAILGYADLAAAALGTTGEVRADVAEIRRAAERAARLTQQILAFTRKDVPQAGPVDVTAVVKDMAGMLRPMVGEDIDLVVNYNSRPCTVYADVGHLQQVLMNLVVNARDAMPNGGGLWIATSRLVADSALRSLHPEVPPGEYVLLEVADEGLGMTDAVRARLFEPFFTTKEPGRGTGLGLSMVSSIVKESNGHILVDSAPGRGTRFSVLWPIAPEPEYEEGIPSFDRRRLDGHSSVLLVEDDSHVRSLAGLWLRRYGYTVHEASDGQEAVALVTEEELQPDILVTDLIMPGTGGASLAASMRPVFSSMKVLYVSGYARHPDLESGLGQRGVAFLQKPFPPARLLSAVRTLLSWSGPERRNSAAWRSLPPPAGSTQ